MNIRVKLNNQLCSQLKAHRANLTALLATAIKSENKTSLLDTERQRLETAIENLEAADTLSDANAHKLSMKREQLRQVTARLAAAEDKPASAEAAALMVQYLLEFRSLLTRSVRPIQDAVFEEIAAAMRPYFGDSNLVEQIIPQSLPFQALANFNSRAWGLNVTNPVRQAKDAIKIIDQLLAGKNPIKLL